jgi:hypothetical protein
MIYRNRDGELWCECGNTADTWEFFPLGSEGNRSEMDDTEVDQKVYKCEKCGAIVLIDDAPVKEQWEDTTVVNYKVATIEVRRPVRPFKATCGHNIAIPGLFVLMVEDGKTFCSNCGPKHLEGLLLLPRTGRST